MEDMTLLYKAMLKKREGMTYLENVILPGAVWHFSMATTIHLAWLNQLKSFGSRWYDFLKSYKHKSHAIQECLKYRHGMTFLCHTRESLKAINGMTFCKSYNSTRYDFLKSCWECLIQWHGMTFFRNVMPSQIIIKLFVLIE